VTSARPAGRFEWEQTVLRGRWTGLIKGNGTGTRGGVSGAVFRAVAWALCSHAGPDGDNIWPGDSTVAVLSEVGLKNVRAVKSTLISLGFLAKVRVGPRRLGGGDVYCLTLPQGTPAAVTILSPTQIKADVQRVSDGGPARRKRAEAADAGNVAPRPADLVEPAVVPGPLDVVQEVVPGPVDRVESSCTGSTGPANDGCTGSKRTVVPGPVDRHNNHDQLQATNQSAAADKRVQRAGTLFAANPKISRPLQVILDTLADASITEAEARQVQNAWITAAKPRGIRLYEHVADEGGIPWRSILADIRVKAKAADAELITKLTTTGTPCPHGQPGGEHPHPRTGDPLCPLCRRGTPAPDHNAPKPVETFRRLYTAVHGQKPSLDLMAAVGTQHHELARRGATARQLDAVAASAAINGHDLIAELRAQKERASA